MIKTQARFPYNLVFGLVALFLASLATMPAAAQQISRMEFKNQPITDILLVLAEASGISIVTDETINGNASFYFSETDIRTALRSFLGAQRIYMREIEGVIYVSRIEVSYSSDGLVRINAEEVDPSLILKAMSRAAGKTILNDTLPKSTVTVHIENVPLEEAVRIVAARFPEYELVVSPTSLYLKRMDSVGKKPVAAVTGDRLSRGVDGLYSINFEQASFLEILDTLMSAEHKEYVLMLRGDFSIGRMRHTGKSFEEALNLLLEQAGADFVERDGIVYLFEIQKKDIVKKLRDTNVLSIKYLPVQDLVTMLPQELSNSAFFRVDKVSNSMILTGSEQELGPLLSFISSVDVPPTGGKIYTPFSLKFIKAKDALALIPPRMFPLTPIIGSDEYSFIALVTQESSLELSALIKLIDRKASAVPIRLKYIKTDELLKLLPPSVSKEDVVDSGFPGLIFFNGSEERRRRFELELATIDRPKPQIQYDILVLQSQSGYAMNIEVTGSAKDTADDADLDAKAIIGAFEDLLSINFDVISEFGYTFAAKLTAEISTTTSEVYADTKLTGIVGQDVKFQNTNTYRYRDSEIDPDDGTVQSTGVTRELTSGLLLSINGWASSDGMITMTIATTVSERGESSSDSTTPPQTSERVVSTQVRTLSGTPIAITGLIQRNRSLTLKKIPILGDIPLLGKLFSFPTESDTQTEFSVYIVPRLVTGISGSDAGSGELGAKMSALYRSVAARP